MSYKLEKKYKDIVKIERKILDYPKGGDISVALVYPNTYSVGMSNLGFQTVYHQFNKIPSVVCQRAFLPSKDELIYHKKEYGKLATLEEYKLLRNFDIIAFSISYELDFLNLFKILDLANIPHLSKDRDESFPLICAGGVAVSLNPEPVAELVDCFLIGEAEIIIPEFITEFRQNKTAFREKLLESLAKIPGVYVPQFYKFTFQGLKISKIIPQKQNIDLKIKKRTVKNLDFNTYSVILSKQTEFKNTFLLEINRSCPHNCKFCVVSWCYHPLRWRDINLLTKAIQLAAQYTDKIGLISSSVGDYPFCSELIDQIKKYNLKVAFSSLRVDSITKKMIEILIESGQHTLTLAPEAANFSLRKSLNKDLSDEQIFKAVKLATTLGITNLRLYFMTGLPSEKDSDLNELIKFIKTIFQLQQKLKTKQNILTISINQFIPKPFTPFQWEIQENSQIYQDKIKKIKSIFKKNSQIKIQSESPRMAALSGIISHADRRITPFLQEIYQNASLSNWKKAQLKSGLDLKNYLYRKRAPAEILPWEILQEASLKNSLLKAKSK